MPGGLRVNGPRHRLRAHERDGPHPRMRKQPFDRLFGALDQVEHALRKASLLEELSQPDRAQRRALRGLEDEGVAGDHGQREHPERDHHREVEGRDPRTDADRVAIEVLVHAGRNVAQRAALKQCGRAAREVHHLDSAAHLPSRLLERLAVVPGDDRGQLLEMLFEERLEPEHQAHALQDRGA